MLIVKDLQRPGLAPASLVIGDGECVCISGASGSGKTLLLRAIADLDPNDGTVRLDGSERQALPAAEWRRRVAFVPAEPGWWADYVGEHFPEATQAKTLLDSIGLATDALGWPVTRCSTGERQRLALARALAGTPRVLLLDEPTAALDTASKARIEAVFRERLAAGVGLLIVSHDDDQIRRLAHRRLVMDAGTLSPAAGG